jgi:hypothetical protein
MWPSNEADTGISIAHRLNTSRSSLSEGIPLGNSFVVAVFTALLP